MNLLVAPAGYSFGDSTLGSEGYYSFMILKGLAERYGVNIMALTLYSKFDSSLPKNLTVIELDKSAGIRPTPTLMQRIAFTLGYTIEGIKALRENFDIIHHLSPSFTLKFSFNSLALLGLTRQRKFVIGPVFGIRKAVEDGTFLTWDRHARSDAGYKMVRLSKEVGLPELLFRRTLKHCDALIAATPTAKRLFADFIEPEKIHVIPLGVDTETFSPALKSNQSTSKKIQILAVGALVKRKGFDLLIIALYKLLRMNKYNLELRIIGDGPMMDYLKRLTISLGILNKVKFEGSIPRSMMPVMYREADILVHPAISDPFPSVPLEAMACEKPVVMTTGAGVSEFFEPMKECVIVPSGSSDALFDAILLLLEDEQLRMRLGYNARKKVESRFAWDSIVDKYLVLYKEIL